MDKKWAVIVGGVVQNVIVANDAFIDSQLENQEVDSFVDLSDMDPANGMPGPGWLWDGEHFTPGTLADDRWQ